MKKFIQLFVVIILSLQVKAQDYSALKQRWFNKNIEQFYVGDIFDAEIKTPKVYEKTCYVINDTTIVYNASYKRTFGNGKEDIYIEKKEYDNIRKTADTLILRMPKSYWDSSRHIDTFYNEKNITDNLFKFQKLQFAFLGNYSPWGPVEDQSKVFSLIIDSVGNITYQGVYNTTPYKGLFKGKLSKLQMKQLSEKLKKLWIEYQPIERKCALDATVQNLILYANNKRYETKGCEGNYFLDQLFNLFWNYNSDKKLQMTKYNGKFKLEE